MEHKDSQPWNRVDTVSTVHPLIHTSFTCSLLCALCPGLRSYTDFIFDRQILGKTDISSKVGHSGTETHRQAAMEPKQAIQ